MLAGVFNTTTLVSNPDRRAIGILRELDVLVNADAIPDERTIGDMLFSSHNKIAQFYRDPNKTKEHVEQLKIQVEIYFQCNVLLFSEINAFTPYKAKLLTLINAFECGTAISLYDHLAEATESSNHGSHLFYQNHTVRDGGYTDRNVCSEFSDLFHSFMKCMQRAVASGNLPIDGYEQIVNMDVEQTTFMESYLKIVQTPQSIAQLQIGKSTPGQQLKGMGFATVGRFAKGVTAKLIEEIILSLGGYFFTSSLGTLSEKYGQLRHHYIVVQSIAPLETYAQQDGVVEGIPLNWIQTTRGDFQYISPKFLVDCDKEKRLLDPSAYIFQVDRSKFISNKRKSITKFTERQRGIATSRLATSTVRQRSRSTGPSLKRTREEFNEMYRKKTKANKSVQK